jgi:UDP-glucose 4-epimerase
MRVLVTGGAGYIGSHMTRMLQEAGHETLVLDDLSTGFRDAVPEGMLIEGDCADRALLGRLFSAQRFDAVVHFAARSRVGESVARPGLYYAANVAGTLALADAMVAHGVRRLVFSSSAAIFGEPRSVPIDERHPAAPINPYGRAKWMIEEALTDYERAHGLRAVCLRYFNAAGAHPAGGLGERHDPETHLVPLALRAAAGRLDALNVFGTDYDTPDGTCVRDYVHVCDLCEAHLRALEHLMRDGASACYNLGNGSGFSVREVIRAVTRVTGRPVRVREAARRPGDPAWLVADSARAARELGWQPRFADLETIVAHAWAWERESTGLAVA